MIQLAVIPVMIAGGISFAVHDQFLKTRRLSVLWQNSQHRALWLLLGLGTVLLVWENYWYSGEFQGIDSLFQWVSALGTCGFSTVDVKTWSPGAKLLLSVGMLFGATVGSTVGGLKLRRVVLLFQGVIERLKKLWELATDRPAETQTQVRSAALLGMLWLSAIAVSVFILLHLVGDEYRLGDVIFESASALGNVGLSTGISNPELPALGKLVLIVLMWMGRLEIIPVLVLFSSLKWGKQRSP